MNEQRNLILAIVLSVGILLTWDFVFKKPVPPGDPAGGQQSADTTGAPNPPAGSIAPPAPAAGPPASTGAPAPVPATAGAAVPAAAASSPAADAPRLPIAGARVRGSLRLDGARFDDLLLNDYREAIDPGSSNIVVLAPTGSANPYYAEFGWAPAGDASIRVPGATTRWQTTQREIGDQNPAVLTWDNGDGLVFSRSISVDENYAFTITQRVENKGTQPVTLHPYGLISRTGTPKTLDFYILHEGPLGVLNDTLREVDYDELQEEGPVTEQATGGWLGITDKYWLVALVPDQRELLTARFVHANAGSGDKYQVDYLGAGRTIPPGSSIELTNHLFAGAKEVNLLDRYSERLGVARFDLAVDFGWFYFLTKPIFFVLDYLFRVIGNFGIAIILFTVLIRVLFYPLASKAFRSMHAMRTLQPEMQRLREQYGNDRQKLQQSVMELYRREKVNPMAGCLPIAMQIPVFFALYKVLFVTIEMRHAPFYGWIHDLSAADPTTIFNLFGLVPWDPPTFLQIGVWPLVMGVTMFLQQKINPQPVDPIQAKMFLALPIVFTFILAQFPAGLVIYWTWNNLLSMAQQWIIYKRAGINPRAHHNQNKT
jgi:YidC/Oxa1 family membrane protein insertase